jgi:CHASE1-domain containing sensor protein
VRALLMSFTILVCGLTLTTVVANWDARNIDQLVQAKIDQDAERLEHEIVRNFEQPLNILMTARGMFQTQGQINRSALESYINSQDVFREFPGIRAIGYAQPVAQDDLKKFETSVRNEGDPNYTIKVRTDTDIYYLVKYITPVSGNEMALGVDLGRDKIRREALLRAIHSGQAALSGHITLLQDNNSLKGFLFLLPMYQQGLVPPGPEERQRALMGLLYAPIDLNAAICTPTRCLTSSCRRSMPLAWRRKFIPATPWPIRSREKKICS